MSTKKLNFEMLYSKRFPLGTDFPDRVYTSDVNPRFVNKRRESENKRADLKIKHDFDYPLEREL